MSDQDDGQDAGRDDGQDAGRDARQAGGATAPLAPLPALSEDWQRALAVVAHPDDLEYGVAAAVARWTSQGKDVRYLLATRGEAGIQDRPPAEVGPLREHEQREAAAAVGVTHVDFLDHADGLLVGDLALRRDLAAAIRAHAPEVLLAISFDDSWGGTSWNHVDHRVIGAALLDAARDAANPWVFEDAGPACAPPRLAAFSGALTPTHAVDVSDHVDAWLASLRSHAAYFAGIGDPQARDTIAMVHGAAREAGVRQGVAAAITFQVYEP